MSKKLPPLRGVRLSEYALDVFCPLFQNFKNSPYIFYGGYDAVVEKGWEMSWSLSDNDIYAFVVELGRRLHQWRKNPTLEDAQELRRIFVELEEIDAFVDLNREEPKPVFSLMGGVENVAWALRKAEATN